MTDGEKLHPLENISPMLIRICVDCLTRFMDGSSKEEAFSISLLGARLIKKQKLADKLLANITGLDDDSIRNACQLSGFDVVYRAV